MTDDTTPPLSPAGDGRGPRGRFGPGNRHGRGNPLNRRVQRLRAAMLKGVTPADITAAVEALVAAARAGDLRAIDALLDRTLGKPASADLLERLERLEALIAGEKPKRASPKD